MLLLGGADGAEDLLQDALEKAWPRWPRLRTQEPEAYVRRSMLNRAISRWRSPWVRNRSEEFPDARDARDDFRSSDDREMVMRALRRLPPRMRAVIVLRFWLGFSEMETAAHLGGSVGSVKSQASRGLRRLRADLETSTGVADA